MDARTEQPIETMKMKHLVSALVLPLVFAGCESKPETTTEKMDAAADKVAEGVREMAAATKERTDAAVATGKDKLDAPVDQAAIAAEKAKANLKDASAETRAAADKAAQEAARALEDAKRKIHEATE